MKKYFLSCSFFLLLAVAANADVSVLNPLAGTYQGVDETGASCTVTIQGAQSQRAGEAPVAKISYASTTLILNQWLSDTPSIQCKYVTRVQNGIVSVRTYTHDESTVFYQLDLGLSSGSSDSIDSVTVRSGASLLNFEACRELGNASVVQSCSRLRKLN